MASRTSALLTDWETDLGLPDECTPLATTPDARRAAVVGKLISTPDLSPESFRRIGRGFGVDLTVTHLDQTRADLIPNLDTTNGRWRFVWWIEIPSSADIRYFTMSSDVGTPLSETDRNTELECRLQKASPAHTRLVIGYVDVVQIPALDARSGERGTAIVAFTLPEATGGTAPYTYTLVGIPPGLAFDDGTRGVSGTPTAAGQYTATYEATDTDGFDEHRPVHVHGHRAGLDADVPGVGCASRSRWNRGRYHAGGRDERRCTAHVFDLRTAARTRVQPDDSAAHRDVPLDTGSGTITITATNSEGSATWTIDYAIT